MCLVACNSSYRESGYEIRIHPFILPSFILKHGRVASCGKSHSLFSHLRFFALQTASILVFCTSVLGFARIVNLVIGLTGRGSQLNGSTRRRVALSLCRLVLLLFGQFRIFKSLKDFSDFLVLGPWADEIS
jgi:hypothetical protein